MVEINKLIEIAKELNLSNETSQLSFYKERLEQQEKELVLPIVGEFSSGKTSLINALLDNKKLEVASKPTTATIYEVRFGSPEWKAEIIDEEGNAKTTKDIEELKNATLADVPLVKVFDTSTQVNPETILVDTPGLSSNEVRHKVALTSYLPNADAILLVADVNQQITRSLIDFVDTSKMASCPIFLVITKCDTKTPGEVASVKEYIKSNIDLPLENMVSVSAQKGDLKGLLDLLEQIQLKKNKIVENAVNERVKGVAASMLEHISKLLQVPDDSVEIDKAINKQESKLRELTNNIDNLIKDASSKIGDKEEEALSTFKTKVFNQLDCIIATQGRDCDDAVRSSVNETGSMILENYKKEVQYILVNLARERQRSVKEVPLQFLETLDMSNVVFNGFSYNMNLSQLGHEFDKNIGRGILAAAAITAVVATAGAATPVAAAAGAAGGAVVAGGKAVVAGGVMKVVDTGASLFAAARAGKLVRNQMIRSAGENALTQLQQGKDPSRGKIETGVGWITDKITGKPQRRRAIDDYINNTLIPEFSTLLQDNGRALTTEIGTMLRSEAQQQTANMEESLKQMKIELESKEAEYKERRSKLKEYKQILKA